MSERWSLAFVHTPIADSTVFQSVVDTWMQQIDQKLYLQPPGSLENTEQARDRRWSCALCRLIAVGDPHFAHHLHRRQLAKRVQLVEDALAALDHPWNDIVVPVTDGDLEHVEDLCR